MPEDARLILVRHCEASAQHADAPLTARGLTQADALAPRLAPLAPDAMFSSPYLRARQSIAPLAQRLGLPITIDKRLRERHLGEAPDDAWRAAVRASFEDLDRALPGGESSRAAQQRARAAIDDIVAGGFRLPVIATHGNLLALLLTAIDARFGYAGWESLTNPDVFVVAIVDGSWAYQRLADD